MVGLFKVKKQSDNLDDYLKDSIKYGDTTLVLIRTSDKEVFLLKDIADKLINKVGKGVVFISNENDESVNFICRSNCDVHAGLTVKRAAQMSLGNGGESPTFAQGGGKTLEHIEEIFESIKKELNDKINLIC